MAHLIVFGSVPCQLSSTRLRLGALGQRVACPRADDRRGADAAHPVRQVRIVRERTTGKILAMKKLKKSEMLKRGQVGRGARRRGLPHGRSAGSDRDIGGRCLQSHVSPTLRCYGRAFQWHRSWTVDAAACPLQAGVWRLGASTRYIPC